MSEDRKIPFHLICFTPAPSPKDTQIVKHFNSSKRNARARTGITLKKYSQKKIYVGRVRQEVAKIIALAKLALYVDLPNTCSKVKKGTEQMVSLFSKYKLKGT